MFLFCFFVLFFCCFFCFVFFHLASNLFPEFVRSVDNFRGKQGTMPKNTLREITLEDYIGYLLSYLLVKVYNNWNKKGNPSIYFGWHNLQICSDITDKNWPDHGPFDSNGRFQPFSIPCHRKNSRNQNIRMTILWLEDRLRKGPFSRRINVDGRPN